MDRTHHTPIMQKWMHTKQPEGKKKYKKRKENSKAQNPNLRPKTPS
jgi:hypothetical protein